MIGDMLRSRIRDTLLTKGPMTYEELETALGVPRPILRSILTEEFYNQIEVDHAEHGHMTVWALKPSLVSFVDDKLVIRA